MSREPVFCVRQSMLSHLISSIKPGAIVRWHDPDSCGRVLGPGHVAKVARMICVSSIKLLDDDSVRVCDRDGSVLVCPIQELEVITDHVFTSEQAINEAMEYIQTWDAMELATFLAECYPGERVTVDSTSRMYDDNSGRVVDVDRYA